jgi:uncharacterized protein YggU (UPF0235/DUF167 family)
LKIKIAAPPMDAVANEALVKFLAEKLNCACNCVELIHGRTSRHKVVMLARFQVGQYSTAS